jgi:hypothetical protein
MGIEGLCGALYVGLSAVERRGLVVVLVRICELTVDQNWCNASKWARELPLPGPPVDQLTLVAGRLQLAGMITRFDVTAPSSLVT